MMGSTNLSHLLASMSPDLHDDTFVFMTIKPDAPVPNIGAVMQLNEAEGVSLIAPLGRAKKAGLAYEFPCRRITLNIHSSLEAVGFLAVITTHLAKLNVGVNPVSGFYHDHLFIPEDRADDVMAALAELSQKYRDDIKAEGNK
ncbi:MAG: ACT domain-containing protein [Alphaproteobacteria bacterium]